MTLNTVDLGKYGILAILTAMQMFSCQPCHLKNGVPSIRACGLGFRVWGHIPEAKQNPIDKNMETYVEARVLL